MMLSQFLTTFLRSIGAHRGGGAPQHPVSIWDALEEFVSPEELGRVVATTPDRRAVIGAVAKSCGRSAAQIAQRWSEMRGVAFMERIPCADLRLLPPSLTVELLAGAGATVVTEGNKITGIVCVDPDRIERVREIAGDLPLVIGVWAEIERQLAESSETTAEIVAAELRDVTARLHETTTTVLGLVIHEVIGRGGRGVTLDLSGEDPTYAIIDGDKKELRGELHAMLRTPLREILGREEFQITMPNGAPRAIRVVGVDGGERFVLQWEVADPAAGAVCEVTANQREISSHRDRRTVFVIDDSRDFRDVVSRFLERHGFTVRAFGSAEDAWAALEEGVELDIIVCDIHMPGMSGYEFIQRLRATGAGRGVPVVALTSADDVETEIRAIRAGIAAFVSKSADPRVLCAHVERWCREGMTSERF